MGLETGTYINSLVATNPTSGDPKAQGDDHLRLVKSTILATFPNVTGAVTATHAQLNAPTSAAGTVSGTAIDFTSIPSWVKRITVSVAGISTNGTSGLILQLGDSGGVETTTYLGESLSTKATVGDGIESFFLNGTTGINLSYGYSASETMHGSVTLTLTSSNTWVASGVVSSVISGDFGAVTMVSGSKALSGTLDRVRLTTSGGSDTFDAGAVTLMYD